ncbi:MAG: SDR family oxidoreductase [Chloroflexi bacterium]|nr:SDR family oxidoreductase [Chloroflexota bacterium]
MSKNTILVTGATGHIGNVLVRKLVEQGEKVRALTLPGENTNSLHGVDVELIHGDVLDNASLDASLKGVRQVFHLAGIISIMPGENMLIRRVNVEGTVNVLKAAVRAGVERLVYTSSIHALARIPHGTTVDEAVPYDPENTYGVYDQSKAQATLQVQRAVQAGLDAVIACPTGVIGPFDFRSSMMGEVIRSAALRRLTPYVDGAYDFVDVRDVADGLIAAAQKGLSGSSYILSGQRISVRYLLDTVHEVTGNGFARFKVPLPLAEFAARFTPLYYRLSQASPRFTPYSLEVLQSNSFISHAKASRELGYTSRPLLESIHDAIQWFFEHYHLQPELIGQGFINR